MVAGGRIERPLAMGYEPMLGTSTLPASNWHPRRDSSSRIFRFEAGCLIRFGYGGKMPASRGLWFTESVMGYRHAWWMEQVPTLRPPVLHTGALPTELPIRCLVECLQGWPAGYDPASRGPRPRVLPLNYGHTCRHSSGMPGGTRTPDEQFWRLSLCQLSYRHVEVGVP